MVSVWDWKTLPKYVTSNNPKYFFIVVFPFGPHTTFKKFVFHYFCCSWLIFLLMTGGSVIHSSSLCDRSWRLLQECDDSSNWLDRTSVSGDSAGNPPILLITVASWYSTMFCLFPQDTRNYISSTRQKEEIRAFPEHIMLLWNQHRIVLNINVFVSANSSKLFLKCLDLKKIENR